MHIMLTPFELSQAAQVGSWRRIVAIKKAREHRHGYTGDNMWDMDIEAACAEFATAKALGVAYATPIHGPTDEAGDIGRLQVRHSKRGNASLIVHKSDSDDAPFVLVTGQNAEFTVCGWMMGRDAKRDEFWEEKVAGRPAYFVPQYRLHYDLDKLGELVG